MKFEITRKEKGEGRLILIFAGWGSGPDLYRHIGMPGWDTGVAYDYDDFEFPLESLEGYTTIYLYAWSLGVYAAARSLQADRITSAFAVNGTLYPCDALRGIPPAIYKGTRERLDAANLRKFRLRMAGGREALAEIEPKLIPYEAAELLKAQLQVIEDDIERGARPGELPWERAYVSELDRIFPPESQYNAWADPSLPDLPETIGLRGASHYVDISRIVAETINDTSKIGERFRTAITTYEANASAQRLIADRLTRMLADTLRHPGGRMLEIGCGSGLLTRLAGPVARPSSAIFMELYEVPPFGIAPEETYITGDAEEEIKRVPTGSIDLIISASAIQWFADPRSFFEEAARVLAPGGLMVCSTFLPGNLRELDTARNAPMRYHSRRALERYLGESFGRQTLVEEELHIEFDTPREALLHLKHTGVGGSGIKGEGLGALIKALTPATGDACVLTYMPLYIVASAPKRSLRRSRGGQTGSTS